MKTASSPRNASRGIALILVVLVLAALVVIGTPFVLSMRLQEQGAIKSLAVRQAEYAALSARNFTVANLIQTHPARESGMVTAATSAGGKKAKESKKDGAAVVEPPAAPNSKIDDLAELEVDLSRIELSIDKDEWPEGFAKELETRAWNGQILDARVEDEQSKVNINSASASLIGNLLGGSNLSEALEGRSDANEIAVEDTSVFPADEDPDTIDGVLVILNPQLMTVEAISYRDKNEKQLTRCTRGEYFSFPQDHEAGFPIFDLRGFKVFLHRYYDLDEGVLKSFRTPQSIREIAEWSVVPYFLKNLAVLGLNSRNMKDFGLTLELLQRAGLGHELLKRDEPNVDEKEYRAAKHKLDELGVPSELVKLLEDARGKSGVIQGAEAAEEFQITKENIVQLRMGFEAFAKPFIDKLKTRGKAYYPKAVEYYKQIYNLPGAETFTARDFERIRDLITTTSAVGSEWSPEQMVIGKIQLNPLVGVPSLQVARTDWFNPGTLVRIRSIKDPSKVEYQLAWVAVRVGVGGQSRGRGGNLFQGGIYLKGPLRYSYDEREAVVSSLLRHPVNINTAPRAVLEAILKGLRPTTFAPPGQAANAPYVSSLEAKRLIDYLIAEMPIVGFHHFRMLIEEAAAREIIHDDDVRTILTNALNPNHPSVGTSTAGFCYATGDVYSVESMGIINNPGGLETARSHVREVLEVAPADPLRLTLESQDDFAFGIFRTQSPLQARWDFDSIQLPARDASLMITTPIPLNRRQWECPSQKTGSVKALTAEHGEDRFTWGTIEHFPYTIEGQDTTEEGAFTKSTTVEQQDPATGGGTGGAAQTTVDDVITRPGAVEFWVRPNWPTRGGDRTFFDSLADPALPEQNRIRLYFDGSTKEIVFQIMDDAGLQKGTPGGVKASSSEVLGAAEIRHPVSERTLANDTWYHVMALWGSTMPGDQALFIDGRPVGRNTWMTQLGAPLAIAGRKVTLKDAEIAARFPSRGTLLVGTEAIDYDSREGNVFVVRSANPAQAITDGRGVRGTVTQEHPRGSPVRLFGYAIDIAPSDPDVSMATSGNWLLVGKGGAKLEQKLPISYIWTRTQGLVPFTYPMIYLAPILPALNGTQTQIDIVPDPFYVGADPITLGFPPKDGYMQVTRYVRVAGFLYLSDGVEFIKYARIGASSQNGQVTYSFIGLGRGMLGTQPLDPSNATSNGQTLYQIVSVSIETNVTDLGERYPPSGILQLDRGFGGTGRQTNQILADVEWIRYWTIAEDHYFIAAPETNNDAFRGFAGAIRFISADLRATGDDLYDENTISEHPAGQEIYPVLRLARPYAGREDFVSVGDTEGAPGARKSEPRLLRVRKVLESDAGTFLSFYQQTAHTYYASGLPKMKRFPSGELPSRSSGRMTFGGPAAPNAAGAFGGHIDEICLSRIAPTDVEITAFPMPGGKRVQVFELPDLRGINVRRRALRSYYTLGDKVESGADLDKVLLLGQARLQLARDAEGNITGREYSKGDPRLFGLQREESLFTQDGEVFHFARGSFQDSGAPVQLLQNLPRDPFVVDSADPNELANTRNFDPQRDLRNEVVERIKVSSTDNLPAQNGFVEIVSDEGREVIFYEFAGNRELRNCLRGQLGTDVRTYIYEWERWAGAQGWVRHTREIFLRAVPQFEIDILSRSMLNSEKGYGSFYRQTMLTMPHVAVTRATGELTDTGLAALATQDFPREDGYLILDDGNPNTADEVIAYAELQGNQFLRARDERTGRGLFRGRFGTPSDRAIGGDTALVHFNARYHDRYDPEVDSPELAFLQRSLRIPGARWDKIEWSAQEQRNRTFKNEVRVAVRFDGAPAWDEKPANAPGGLFLFSKGDTSHKLGVEADEIEFRVYFRYPPGSYGPLGSGPGGMWSDDWKHSPILDALHFDYRKRTRVLHHESLPF
ncbi:MAG: LamG domain-containing protein [Planctomycetes bacterium]|nr:LamG domain-containing protein [Planctomycetota bacterium]